METFNNHNKEQHSEKGQSQIFHCPKCTKTYTKKRSLSFHVKSKHQEKVQIGKHFGIFQTDGGSNEGIKTKKLPL